MKRRFIPGIGALVATALVGGAASADPVAFSLNPKTSQLILCEQDQVLNYLPRVFLAGKVTVDFLGTPEIPASGQAAIDVPAIDVSGVVDPAQAEKAVRIDSLSFMTSVGATTTGFVEGVDPGTDLLVIDKFGFALNGQVTVNLPPDPEQQFPLAEDFNEADAGASTIDFNGVLTALGGGDCDLAGICGFTNEGASGIPDVDAPCDPDTFCDPEDFCVDVTLENSPFGGSATFKVKMILAGTNSSAAQGTLALREAAGLGEAPLDLDVVPAALPPMCGTLDGMVTQADALALLGAAIGDTASPLPCGG